MSHVFHSIGYSRVPPERLPKLISKDEYQQFVKYKTRTIRSYLDVSETNARLLFDKWVSLKKPIKEFAKSTPFNHKTLSTIFKRYFRVEYEDHVEQRKSHNYQRGRDLEYKTRDVYRAQGYYVLRSPRSAGPADLVAMKKGEVLLIQCKTRKILLGKKEREELKSLAESIGAKALLAYRDKGVKIEEL